MKAIIFDLDGTLVDAYPGLHESLNHTLRHFGRDPVDLTTVKKWVGRGVENLIATALGKEFVSSGVSVFKESYAEAHKRGTSIIPGVPEILNAMQKRGVKMAVASNKPREFTMDILRDLHLIGFFADVGGPSDQIPPKPHPAMLHALMKSMDVTAAETLYVGDMKLDVDTARAAGVRVALVSTGGGEREDLMNSGADYVFETLGEIVQFIRGAGSKPAPNYDG